MTSIDLVEHYSGILTERWNLSIKEKELLVSMFLAIRHEGLCAGLERAISEIDKTKKR